MHERVPHRTVGLTIIMLYLCVCSTVHGAQSVKLQATLTPEHLGQGTTIGLGFQITTPADSVPSPLTGVEVSYPVELGFALSELGLATCTTRTLQALGPKGCPPNSLMGYGTALAEIPVGPEILEETAHVTIVRTNQHNGHTALLIYAEGESPVSAQIVFPGLILPAPAPFGGRIDMEVPLVPSLPDGPDVAIVKFHSTLGPLHLHYNEHIHGRIIKYKPRGIPLPTHCPQGGFTFAAKFVFKDSSIATARATVPCPVESRQHRKTR
jgi:hypothetical protein